MTADPEGIETGVAFREYLTEFREAYPVDEELAADHGVSTDIGYAATSQPMNPDTIDDGDQFSKDMTRRAFAAGVGAVAATAAGAGTAAAQESDAPNFETDYVQSPTIVDTVTIAEHSEDMSSVLEYINDSGEVTEHPASVAAREDADTPHNPVTLRADRFATYEYREFPRGETYEDADGNEQDLNAVDADQWTVDASGTGVSPTIETVTAANGEDALRVATSGQGTGDVALFSFTDVDITSGVDRKYIQLVANVVGLGADTAVYIRARDSASNTVETWIDSSATETDLGTLATATGSGIVYQSQVGEFSTSLDDIQELEITIEDGDADLELPAINLDRESRWEFGTREFTNSDDELETETLHEPSGEFDVTEFGSLPDVFAGNGVMDVMVDFELDAADLDSSMIEYRWADAERYDREHRLETLIGYDLPTAYDLSYAGGSARDTVHYPGSRFLEARFARRSEMAEWSDVEDISWSDRSSDYSDAAVGDELTVTSEVNSDEVLVFNFDVLMSDGDREEATASSGGGAGGGPTSSGGGFFTSVYGILATAGAGVLGYIMWAKRRATGA